MFISKKEKERLENDISKLKDSMSDIRFEVFGHERMTFGGIVCDYVSPLRKKVVQLEQKLQCLMAYLELEEKQVTAKTVIIKKGKKKNKGE